MVTHLRRAEGMGCSSHPSKNLIGLGRASPALAPRRGLDLGTPYHVPLGFRLD